MIRLVIRADISTRNFADMVHRVPELLSNDPKMEIWIDNTVCAETQQEAIEFLRMMFKDDSSKAEAK